jgi:hypothetical protein
MHEQQRLIVAADLLEADPGVETVELDDVLAGLNAVALPKTRFSLAVAAVGCATCVRNE